MQVKRKEEEKDIITPHDLPSREEALREDIEWWSKLTPLQKIKIIKRQQELLRRMGIRNAGR